MKNVNLKDELNSREKALEQHLSNRKRGLYEVTTIKQVFFNKRKYLSNRSEKELKKFMRNENFCARRVLKGKSN